MPLARLRLQGELIEIRADALRFTPEEVVTFFKQTVELELADDEVAALGQRTEGWAAALQAAALSLSGRKEVADFIKTFTGSHRYIMDSWSMKSSSGNLNTSRPSCSKRPSSDG